MSFPGLEKLLILQDRDTRRLSLEAQLRAVPEEITRVQRQIASKKEAIEGARSELRDLESRRKILETEVGAAEDQLARYKNQQMQVRKNDEYQALGHEITQTQESIGTLEEKELQILYAMDEARRRFAEAEAELKRDIAGHEDRIRSLGEREISLKAELEEARRTVDTARAELSDIDLRLYDRIAAHLQPVCVPIRAGKCGGCHLKVSSEVESAVRSGKLENGLPVCDQCGRIVYWEG